MSVLNGCCRVGGSGNMLKTSLLAQRILFIYISCYMQSRKTREIALMTIKKVSCGSQMQCAPRPETPNFFTWPYIFLYFFHCHFYPVSLLSLLSLYHLHNYNFYWTCSLWECSHVIWSLFVLFFTLLTLSLCHIHHVHFKMYTRNFFVILAMLSFLFFVRFTTLCPLYLFFARSYISGAKCKSLVNMLSCIIS